MAHMAISDDTSLLCLMNMKSANSTKRTQQITVGLSQPAAQKGRVTAKPESSVASEPPVSVDGPRSIDPPPHRTGSTPARPPFSPPLAKRSRPSSFPSRAKHTAHRHPPVGARCRMPRSLAGGDLAVPEMAQPYMKKDDDDEDGQPPLLPPSPAKPYLRASCCFRAATIWVPLPVLVCRI